MASSFSGGGSTGPPYASSCAAKVHGGGMFAPCFSVEDGAKAVLHHQHDQAKQVAPGDRSDGADGAGDPS